MSTAESELREQVRVLRAALAVLIDYPPEFFEQENDAKIKITVPGWALKDARAALAKTEERQ